MPDFIILLTVVISVWIAVFAIGGLVVVARPSAIPIIVLDIVATLALVYVFLFSERGVAAALFALPQQAVLLVSAWTAVTAMAAGHFADGVERPIPFVVADQAPAVIAAVLHAAAIFVGLWRPSENRAIG